MMDYVWLIPLFPFLGFLVNGLLGKSLPKGVVGTIGSLAVGLSFLVTVSIFWQYLSLPVDARPVEKVVFTWISSGTFKAEAAFLVDPLSLIMLLVVSGVSTLIHIYSISYMYDEPGFYRYFSYLNLFVFAMLLLVFANNFLLMFVGWEGVGLCSYLLIGYWYEKKSASDAAKKAFVVNRIGDFGFLLGIFFIFWTFNTINFREVFAQAAANYPVGSGIITAITLLPLRGGHRQIGPTAAVHLAARRHGRSHAGVRLDPRGHHGHRRRLYGGPLQHPVRAGARLLGRGGRGGGAHRHLRRHHRHGPI